MFTKKEIILICPFVDQKFKDHRKKVRNARAVVDFNRPTQQPHVQLKLKKLQTECERIQKVEKENQRLLQKLTQIMYTNRLENFWRERRPNFLNRVPIKTPNKLRQSAISPCSDEDPRAVSSSENRTETRSAPSTAMERRRNDKQMNRNDIFISRRKR